MADGWLWAASCSRMAFYILLKAELWLVLGLKVSSSFFFNSCSLAYWALFLFQCSLARFSRFYCLAMISSAFSFLELFFSKMRAADHSWSISRRAWTMSSLSFLVFTIFSAFVVNASWPLFAFCSASLRACSFLSYSNRSWTTITFAFFSLLFSSAAHTLTTSSTWFW